MVNCELPEDVIFHILLVLPVVSLLRFKSVCKYWNALIDSSTFITRHCLHNQEHSDSLIAHNVTASHWYLFSGEANLCLDISEHLQYLCHQNWAIMCMVGTCNGLICIEFCFSDRVALWNPATRKFTLLTESPVPTDPQQSPPGVYGFGYAVKTNCYKVIKLTQIYNYDGRFFDSTRVEIYNLQTDSWRTDNVDIVGEISNHAGVYWNGFYCRSKLDWPAKETYTIVSFDLSDEVFGVMAFPDPEHLSTDWFPQQLIVVNECIAVVDDLGYYSNTPENRYFNIWVLKDYGIKESWTKLYTIGPFFGGVLQTRFFSKGDFFLFMFTDDEYEKKFLMAWCNPIIQKIQYHPVENGISCVFVYQASLVPVKRGIVATNAV